MKVARWCSILGAGIFTVGIIASPAAVAGASPWLCRDKPVFSFSSPMTFQTANRGGRRWQLMLMRFREGGEHGGFEIVAARNVAPGARQISGNLSAGQYFAVAMYDRRGLWICAPYAYETEPLSTKTVSRICYGDSRSDCRMTLTVVPAASDTSIGTAAATQAPTGAIKSPKHFLQRR
jgi:hypothetical protein